MADDYAAARAKCVVIEERRALPRRNLAALVLVATAVTTTGVNVPTGALSLTAFAPTISRVNPKFIPVARQTSIWPAQEWQPERNLEAAAFVIGGASHSLTVPIAGLILTAFPPNITVGGAPSLFEAGKTVFVERQSVQPRRNAAWAYQSITANPQVIQAIAVPPASLNILGFPPTILQHTPILSGQDLQEVVQPEIWQPERRSFLFALSSPGAQSINIPTAALSLTAFAPTVSVTGTVFIPQANLTLTAFPPDISQQNSGRVDVPIASLTLTGFPPVIGVSGTVFVNLGSLSLTALAPSITQTPAPTAFGPRYIIKRIRARNWTVSATSYSQFDPMSPDEEIKLVFDFTPDLPIGVVLAGTPAVTITTSSGSDQNSAALANGTPSLDATASKVIVPVAGGVSGCNYKVHALCSTSDAQITLSLTGILPVLA